MAEARDRGSDGGVDADAPPEEVAAILAEPADRFVAARGERVRALRAAGRREEAAALAKVRKPPLLVRQVGDLARAAPDAAEAADAAAAAVEAASDGDGDLRAALAGYREALDAVLAAAPVDARVALAAPVRSVLGDPDARASWRAGTLLALPGGAPPASGAPAAPDRPARARPRKGASPSSGRARAGGSAKEVRAPTAAEPTPDPLAERRAARDRRKALDAAVTAAAKAAATARREEAAARRHLDALERRLAALQAEVDVAGASVRAATEAHERSRAALADAEQARDAEAPSRRR